MIDRLVGLFVRNHRTVRLPEITPHQVAEVLRDVIKGADCEIDSGEFDLRLRTAGWWIGIQIKNDRVNYVDIATNPSGQSVDFNFFFDLMEGCPIDMLSELDQVVLSRLWAESLPTSNERDRQRRLAQYR